VYKNTAPAVICRLSRSHTEVRLPTATAVQASIAADEEAPLEKDVCFSRHWAVPRICTLTRLCGPMVTKGVVLGGLLML
jgi:hypothetical protein